MLVSVGSKHFNYSLDTFPFRTSWINLTYYSSVFLDNMTKNIKRFKLKVRNTVNLAKLIFDESLTGKLDLSISRMALKWLMTFFPDK